MKQINLALQGGGALGAYTWGVLDCLLEEKEIEIEGISGTSAGAVNAAVLAIGYEKGGRDGAKEKLEELWRGISELGKYSPINQTIFERMAFGWNLENNFSYRYFDVMSRLFSPYELNPFNFNALKGLLDQVIDFEQLRKNTKIKLFISATTVRTGRARVFNTQDISMEVLLASTCLPYLFQAAEINGDYFWDGGYTGNPSLWPLIYGCHSHDLMLIQINPIVRNSLPKTAYEIRDRINEISFNNSLISEIRAINFVSKLIQKKSVASNRYKDLHLHMIESSEEIEQHLNASSKLNANWDFFLYLKNMGRAAADNWLKHNLECVGVRSSLDIEQVFFPETITEHPYIKSQQHPFEEHHDVQQKELKDSKKTGTKKSRK